MNSRAPFGWSFSSMTPSPALPARCPTVHRGRRPLPAGRRPSASQRTRTASQALPAGRARRGAASGPNGLRAARPAGLRAGGGAPRAAALGPYDPGHTPSPGRGRYARPEEDTPRMISADTTLARLLDEDPELGEGLARHHPPFAQPPGRGAPGRPPAGARPLVVRAPSEPFPLYELLGRRGLLHWTECRAPDDWSVWFYREAGGAPPGAAPARTAAAAPAGGGGRGVEAPGRRGGG